MLFDRKCNALVFGPLLGLKIVGEFVGLLKRYLPFQNDLTFQFDFSVFALRIAILVFYGFKGSF